MDNTDLHWEQWGRLQPYFGVLVDPAFRDIQPGDDAWHAFMETGVQQVGQLLDRWKRLGGPQRFGRALDFGCGVGRLLAPLAAHFDEVVGVDVSPAMRKEAERNLATQGVRNAVVVASDDALSDVTGTFDLVHTFNVLQHIHPRRGLELTERLLDLLEPGGVASLHVCDAAPALRHRVKRIASRWPAIIRLGQRLSGRDPGQPIMQMYPYGFDVVTTTLRARGVTEALVDWTTYGQNHFFQVHAVVPGT